MLAVRYLVIAALAAVTANAQDIVPSSVPLSTRQGWCDAQKYQCPLLCTQINNGSAAVTSNSCDPQALSYSCVCSNGLSPNSTECKHFYPTTPRITSDTASQVSNTLPFYICQEVNQQCAMDCSGNTECQGACYQNHPCGASDPKRYNITATTTSSSASTATATGAKSTGTGNQAAAGNFQTLNGNAGAGAVPEGAGSSLATEIPTLAVSFLPGVIILGTSWLM